MIIPHIPFDEKDPYELHVCKVIDLQNNLETVQRAVDYIYNYIDMTTEKIIDRYSIRIYEILKEHNYIAIDEDKFISLLREDG